MFTGSFQAPCQTEEVLNTCKCSKIRYSRVGTPIWNRRGCSSEILNLTPKGDHLGPWGPFYQLRQVLAKETPTSNLTESNVNHLAPPFLMLSLLLAVLALPMGGL